MISAEIRRRIRIGTKNGLTDEVLERRRISQKLAAARPESRERKRLEMLARMADPEYRARYDRQMADPLIRQKMSDAAKKRGGGFSSEKSKAMLADPAVQARLSAKRKALWADPEYRIKVLTQQKVAQDNPEYRARMSATQKARHAAKKAAR